VPAWSAPHASGHYDGPAGANRQGNQDQETTTRPTAAPADYLVRSQSFTVTDVPAATGHRPGPRGVGLVETALESAGFGPSGRYAWSSTDGRRRSVTAMGHIDALDGIRAVAITMVLVFHLGFPWAHGGYVGVDIFFVLSGFLITGLLVQEHRTTGEIALRRFWARRARRLLPALCLLLLVLAAVSAANPRLLSPTDLESNGLATLFYVQNWHLILLSKHQLLVQAFFPSPLLHTWSLAVEEQFYLVWPLIVVLALRRDRLGRLHPHRIHTVVVVGAVASAVAMAAMALAGAPPLSIYYDSGTRAFELLIGAGLALWFPLGGPASRPRHPRRTTAIAGTVSLGLLVGYTVLVSGIDPRWIYEGGLVAASLVAAVLVWSATTAPGSLVGRALACPPVRALGRISYGVYLWHWPVLVLLSAHRVGFGGGPLMVVQVAITLAAALTSWFLVERPFHAMDPTVAVRRLLVPVVVTAAACLLVGMVVAGPSLH